MITALKEGRRKDKPMIRELRQDFQNKDLSFLGHKMKRILMTTKENLEQSLDLHHPEPVTT